MHDPNNLGFNPDELLLTKKDIEDMILGIIKYWKKHSKSNAHFIIGGYAIIGGLKIVPEKTVVEFWKVVLGRFNAILIENSLAHARNENPTFAKTFEKILKKTKDGDF